MKINNNYKYFVYCNDSDLVVGGYEYKEDAIVWMILMIVVNYHNSKYIQLNI